MSVKLPEEYFKKEPKSEIESLKIEYSGLVSDKGSEDDKEIKMGCPNLFGQPIFYL